MLKSFPIFSALGLTALTVMGCSQSKDAPEPAPKTATAPAKNTQTVPDKAQAKTKADPHDKLGAVTPDELEKLLAAKSVHVFDSNGAGTRKQFGVVPGAKLLASYSSYELSELPAEKDAKLVFYCANTQCSAAPQSAERAVAAGYTDVNTMPEGIMGWAKAGKSVDKPS